MPGETNRHKRKVTWPLWRVGRDVARGRARARLIAGKPRRPILLLLEITRRLQAVNPLLVALVRNARVGIAIVDEDAKLGREVRPDGDGSRTAAIVAKAGARRTKVQRLQDLWLVEPRANRRLAAAAIDESAIGAR